MMMTMMKMMLMVMVMLAVVMMMMMMMVNWSFNEYVSSLSYNWVDVNVCKRTYQDH